MEWPGHHALIQGTQREKPTRMVPAWLCVNLLGKLEF
jgi:hypothetical protein